MDLDVKKPQKATREGGWTFEASNVFERENLKKEGGGNSVGGSLAARGQ